ncbi:MAG TPA: hypothetical protein VGG49_09135 [Steroidobacteraceae bacterium]|jgi:hypothetical protein
MSRRRFAIAWAEFGRPYISTVRGRIGWFWIPVPAIPQSMTVSDLKIFQIWHLTQEPAMIIGIDTLGLLDILVIDYRRMELQIRTRHKGT